MPSARQRDTCHHRIDVRLIDVEHRLENLSMLNPSYRTEHKATTSLSRSLEDISIDEMVEECIGVEKREMTEPKNLEVLGGGPVASGLVTWCRCWYCAAEVPGLSTQGFKRLVKLRMHIWRRRLEADKYACELAKAAEALRPSDDGDLMSACTTPVRAERGHRDATDVQRCGWLLWPAIAPERASGRFQVLDKNSQISSSLQLS
ncbi:hypothetical protein DEU56DRAFT_900211 [Suillus clintonianus]|uniref:uncharacterized protein n=1 Tax=Suillus clintonianus TaxID=1904413 RepID=UPI001B869E35|nr:uncharacterized protein DEU56DRAFT_900211 [Suillus clintonianus]KAG2143638.1 hypothetical protein DEU56DRAFT_900211 [Suillus clintonianus]